MVGLAKDSAQAFRDTQGSVRLTRERAPADHFIFIGDDATRNGRRVVAWSFLSFNREAEEMSWKAS